MTLVLASQVDVDPNVLDEVASNVECDACVWFETRKPNAVVKMPRKPMFNKDIAADVFQYKC